MRFWITKNSELSVREQLVRQVLLGILCDDLPAGHKLPSVRALARQHRIHSNTVSAAYHELLVRGWLELRKGSGLYVRPRHSSGDEKGDLHGLLATLLKSARAFGHEPEEVLRGLELLVRPRDYQRILVVEPDAAMREILRAEISEYLPLPVDAIDQIDAAAIPDPRLSLVVALTSRAADVRQSLPRAVPCISLRLRSIRGSLEGQTKPPPDTLVSIVSRSAEIRQGARSMLIAVGLDPECLCEVDATRKGWQDRLGISGLLVTDMVTARELPPGRLVKVFRVIADSSIEELKQFCA